MMRKQSIRPPRAPREVIVQELCGIRGGDGIPLGNYPMNPITPPGRLDQRTSEGEMSGSGGNNMEQRDGR